MQERAPVQVYVARPRPSHTLSGLLDEADRSHLATRRHEGVRGGSATARALLRAIVRPRPITRLCPDCGRPHGRPLVEGLHVSASYCTDLVLVAVTRAGPIGVDVEARDAAEFAGMDDLVPQMPAEAGLSRTERWVRAEAQLKLTGVGLRRDPALASAPHTYPLDVGAGHVAALASTVASRIEVIDADGLLEAWVASSRTATA